MINFPKFSLIEKNSLGAICDGCGRALKHVYVLKNNETNEVKEFGSVCAQNHMGGKTISEVVEEAISYGKAVAEEDIATNGAIRVQEFQELNSEMLEYIDKNSDSNCFLADMKLAIEKNGTLTQNQYDAVYGMMLEPAVLDDKITNLKLNIFRVKVAFSDWGNTYMLLGETEDLKLVRVYFSSMSVKNEEILINKEILRYDGFDYEFRPSTKFKREITVSGSFDGYKLKRVKLS